MVKIKSIEITNIKGIGNRSFNLDLIPNKPHILVAPNGFGKSSFAIAFKSLKKGRIDLEDNHYYLRKESNRPILELEIDEDGSLNQLIADDTQNTILDKFDVFVINSQVIAKASLRKISGKTVAKSSLEIEPTVLISTIPEKKEFGYNYAGTKKKFGAVGKILPDISELLSNSSFLHDLENEIILEKFGQLKISKEINRIESEIKSQNGTVEEIKTWIQVNKITELQGIEELNKLAVLIKRLNNTIKNEIDSFLAAFQIIEIYKNSNSDFKKSVKYIHYFALKNDFTQMLHAFNTTRLKIKPIENKQKGLIVEWPKAYEISNGERDILSFVILLMKARNTFKKKNCILIIDEIFDYLDDANLISLQYFITNLIEDMKKEGKNFFPILMTHLDPVYFRHFCFNKHKMKISYLKNVASTANPNLLKLVRKRGEDSIKTQLDKHYFHFHPIDIDLTTEFTALNLDTVYAQSNNFHRKIQQEVTKYLNNQTDFCPLAICFGIRVKIESLIYDKINLGEDKQSFLDEHGTSKKLDFCETLGIDILESFYLLGIIYNDPLHWNDWSDIVLPLAIKLENLVIKKLIRDIFSL